MSALIYGKPIQHIKKQRHYFGNRCLSSQSYGFSSSQVWMWELDHKESWALKNWCFWTVVLEKTLEIPLDFKEISPVNPKGNQSWIIIHWRNDIDAEAPILWLPDVKNWLIWKDPDAAAAKSLQLCPTLCDPIDGGPLGYPVPGILQARTLEWVVISFSNAWKGKVKVKSLSHVPLFATPWSAAYQAPPSMGFSRQGYWSGVPLPSPDPDARKD